MTIQLLYTLSCIYALSNIESMEEDYMKKIAILLCGLLLILTACSNTFGEEEVDMKERYGENREITGSYDSNLAMKTMNGTFVGKEENGVVSYKGIPYAQPPTGQLRWKAPVAPEKSDKVMEAYYFGKSSIQTKTETERASLYEQGEDNLTLNVWTNQKNNSKAKPVMVFIHGGSYGWGGTSDPLYDGRQLVNNHDEVILVTINYRTGIMGFMNFSNVKGGENYKESTNAGILDQIMALKWVKNNISNIGGDPNNVTIFGESAGAGSASILLTMPEAKGLFSKVIAQSGSIALTYSIEESQGLTEKLMDKAGASNMDDLLNLSEKQLMDLNQDLNEYNNFPIRDGNIISKDLYKVYEKGAGSDVDLLIGTNADEARYWIGEVGGIIPYKLLLPIMYENNIARITDENQKYVDKFMKLQDKGSTWDITEFYNDLMFRVPAIEQASSHARNGGNTYMYYWTYPSALKHYGASHAVELAYVFNNLQQTIYTGNNINADLASIVQNMWVNFAKTGNPSTNDLVWPKYNEKTKETMVLGRETKVQSNLLEEQRKAMQPLMKYHFNGNYSNLSPMVPFVYKLVAFFLLIIGFIVALIFVWIKRSKKRKKKVALE